MRNLCPECGEIHRASDSCVYICKRCDQRMEHPDEAESCEDMECAMWSYEWPHARVFEDIPTVNRKSTADQLPNLLEANRKYMDTAKSITATADELEAIWGGDSYEIDK